MQNATTRSLKKEGECPHTNDLHGFSFFENGQRSLKLVWTCTVSSCKVSKTSLQQHPKKSQKGGVYVPRQDTHPLSDKHAYNV